MQTTKQPVSCTPRAAAQGILRVADVAMQEDNEGEQLAGGGKSEYGKVLMRGLGLAAAPP